MEEIIFYGLGSLIIPAVIIIFVVWLARRNKDAQPIDWRRIFVGMALTLLVPYFIAFLTDAIFLTTSSSVAFSLMLTLAIIFLLVGIVISRHTVISSGFVLGSITSLAYNMLINSSNISPTIITIIAGGGLAILVYFSYKLMQEKERGI